MMSRDEGDEQDRSSRIGQSLVGNKKESCYPFWLVLGINRNRLSVVRPTRGAQTLSPLAQVLMLPLIDKRGV